MLYCPKYTYKHRKYNGRDCPSWGEEGWTFTPLSGVGSDFQAPISLEDGLIRVSLPEFDDAVGSIIVKVKSTLLMKRVTLLEYTRQEAILSDPDGIINEEFVGGIVAIARSDMPVFSPNKIETYDVDLIYQPESGSVYPMSAIYMDGRPIQLDTRYLHQLRLQAVFDGFIYDIPTAWVDPGFVGTLFAPWMDNSPGKLVVESFHYPGNNRYQGYSGDDRLRKH